jgi:hypothetical protein
VHGDREEADPGPLREQRLFPGTGRLRAAIERNHTGSLDNSNLRSDEPVGRGGAEVSHMTLSPVTLPSRRLRMCLLALALAIAALAAMPAVSHADACTPPVTNPVACENTKPGADPSTWRVDGDGDSTIQGFATSQSVNKGDTISFKIKSSTTNFHIDILRIG